MTQSKWGRAFIFILAACFAIDAEAGSLCRKPKKGFPALAFSMALSERTTARKECSRKLNRARYLGFTEFTFSPVFYLDPSSKRVSSSLNRKDILYCLNKAQRMGFDLTYKPMIESPPDGRKLTTDFGPARTLGDHLLQGAIQHYKMPWRAKFDYKPGSDFQKEVLDPVLEFLSKSKERLLRQKTRTSIVVATELHTSIETHSEKWNAIIWNTQQKVEKMGLRRETQVGMDPSIFSALSVSEAGSLRKWDEKKCESFKKLLWTSDFFAFSTYGDYVAKGYFQNAPQSVTHLFEDRIRELSEDAASWGCVLDDHLRARLSGFDHRHGDQNRPSKTSWMGEIGYAGSLSASYSQFRSGKAPPIRTKEQYIDYRDHQFKSDHQTLRERAPGWVKAVLDSARGQNGKGTDRAKINFWVEGGFDLFGFSKMPTLGEFESIEGQYLKPDSTRGPDEIAEVARIRDELQRYARERCEGWRPKWPSSHRKKREIDAVSQCSSPRALPLVDLSSLQSVLKPYDPPELEDESWDIDSQ